MNVAAVIGKVGSTDDPCHSPYHGPCHCFPMIQKLVDSCSRSALSRTRSVQLICEDTPSVSEGGSSNDRLFMLYTAIR